jgi:hypothetical protein
MNSLSFDTHRVVKRLTEAGFSPTQAETVTDVLIETHASNLSELATKADLRELRAEIRTADEKLGADIRTVEGKLSAEIRALDAKIADSARVTLRWVVGIFIAQTAVFAGLVRLLAGH